MLYAIIDIGSSTIRMAIYNIAYGKMEMLMKKKHTVGLAAYVKDDIMQQQGIDKTCDILNEFRDLLADFKITNVSAFTTAAIRNVKNQAEVIEQIQKRTTIDVCVISGEEEAEFDFIGVVRTVGVDTGIIIDVGGGSTELIYYKDAAIVKKTSIPVGALSLYTKYAEDFLPSSAEIFDMQAEIKQLLKEQLQDFPAGDKLYVCAIGGTAKSARLLYNELFLRPDENMTMQTDKMTDIINKYKRDNPLSESLAITLLKTAPDRLKTIIPGMVIVDEVCSYFAASEITYSDTGMREGFIYKQIIGEN